MLETLLALLTAHLLADFPLQTREMVENKGKPGYFALHIAIVTAAVIIVAGTLDPWIWGSVMVSHALMDFIKIRFMKDGIVGFGIDQLVHVAVLVGLAVWRPDTVSEGLIGHWATDIQLLTYQAMVTLSGLILSVMVGGIVIGKLLKALPSTPTSATTSKSPDEEDKKDEEDEEDEKGLPRGGEYIGWLERGLTLLFVLIGQPEGIGLMLAAKSILRFSDRNARAHTEYVIIGTMLSFGWAILIAVMTKAALGHWG